MEKETFVIPEGKKLIPQNINKGYPNSSTNTVNILKPVIHLNNFPLLDSYLTKNSASRSQR
jgi:hypothetical protein